MTQEHGKEDSFLKKEKKININNHHQA